MRIEALLSPQFDLCYALSDVVNSRPHWRVAPTRWRKAKWQREARKLGSAFWLAVPDILGGARPAATVEQFLRDLSAIPADVARQRLIEGVFHEPDADARQRAAKREWLAFIGVDGGAAGSALQSALASDPAEVLSRAIAVLEHFAAEFLPLWQSAQPRLERLLREAERLAAAGDLGRLAGQLGLKVELVDEGRRLRALRGGYEIALADIGAAYVLPSMVNFAGYWSGADVPMPATLFFPFVDPAEAAAERAQRLPDPWIVCRAIGEPTRAAIIRRLARAPMTSAELMRELELSKANISHHTFQLREAGLIDEASEGRSVRLSLRRETFDGLSASFRKELPAETRPRGPRRR